MNFDTFLILFFLSPLLLSVIAVLYVAKTKTQKLFEEVLKISVVGEAAVLLVSLVYAVVLGVMYVQSSGECMFFSCYMPFLLVVGTGIPLLIATIIISGILTSLLSLIRRKRK